MTSFAAQSARQGHDVGAEISASVGILQGAIRGVVVSVFGESPSPAALARRLGLDAALAWSIMKVAGERSPFMAGLHVPGKRAFARFVDASRGAGASAGAIEAALAAHERFEGVRRSVAGSARELKTILSDLAVGEESGHDLRCRRDAYRANSHLYGLQTRQGTDCKVIYPGASGLDLLTLRILSDVRKLRRDAVCRVQFRAQPSSGGEAPAMPMALCDEDRAIGVGLLTEYCSRPLPEVEQRGTDPVVQSVRTVHEDVGAASPATVTIALCVAGALREEHLRAGYGFTAAARSPIEHLRHDILLPREMLGDLRPEFTLYSRASGAMGSYLYDAEDAMPTIERVDVAESALSVIAADCDPVYLGALQGCLEQLGWEAERLAIVRVASAYPVLNAIGRTVLFGAAGQE